MKTSLRVAVTAIFLAHAFSSVTYAQAVTGDADKGKGLFQGQCGICHTITSNRVGPMMTGVYGRKAGTVPEYNYSPAMKAATLSWDATTLDQWLENPAKLVPGTKMAIKISDPQKRADIIAYLKSDAVAKPAQ